MDKFNLSVYVEQVNHETDSTTVDKWEENEELALNNVIDPNTEFKVIFFQYYISPSFIRLIKKYVIILVCVTNKK